MAQWKNGFVEGFLNWHEKNNVRNDKKFMIISTIDFTQLDSDPEYTDKQYDAIGRRKYAFLPFTANTMTFLPNRILHTGKDRAVASEFLLFQLGENDIASDDATLKNKVSRLVKQSNGHKNVTFNTWLYFPDEEIWEKHVQELKAKNVELSPLQRNIIVGKNNLNAVINYYHERNYYNYGVTVDPQSSSKIFDQ